MVKAPRRKKRTATYKSYIYKVLQEKNTENEKAAPPRSKCSISKSSMNIMNSFVEDMFHRIASEASSLARFNKKRTLTGRDIAIAVSMLCEEELGKHCKSKGSIAVTRMGL
tara:strand:+ start:1964 stop:2296 length:333 start_codon:yes stop_codon:yes gene_type:complete